jgi:hypothetical protein
MKTKITTTVTVEREGAAPETFTNTTPPELTIANERDVFAATITGLELVMSQMHRRYLPTVEEAIEHNKAQEAKDNPNG